MFRGKESSNRIKLSRLVQDLLNFGVLGSLQLWGLGMGVDGVGWLGVGPPPHAHICACMHAHARVVNMIIWCKWLPPLGKSLGIPYDVICACMCICMCVQVGGMHPLTTPHLHPPTPQRGDPQNHSKFNST